MSKKILISACLAGIKCRYNASSSPSEVTEILLKELEQSELIICCPELLAKEPTPRPSCNIHGGDGKDVIAKNAKIIGNDKKDYTNSYLQGATKAVEIAKAHKINKAYLQQRSPSCGCGKIYTPDGSSLKNGDGVFTALLKKEIPNIEIIAL